MSKSSGFQKYSICWVFRHFVCVFVFVVVFVIVFVFVFVSSYDFWIAFIICFQNMYGYRGLWSLREEIMIIFEVMTYIHTPIPLIDSAHPVGWAEWKYELCEIIWVCHTGIKTNMFFNIDPGLNRIVQLLLYCIVPEYWRISNNFQ